MLMLRQITVALIVFVAGHLDLPKPGPTNPGVSTQLLGDDKSVSTNLSNRGRPKSEGPVRRTVGEHSITTETNADDPCWYMPLTATKGDPVLGGDDPSAGVLYSVLCRDGIHVVAHGVTYARAETVWVRNGAPVVVPPPDPAQVAQEAAGTMTAPNPVVNLGPNPATVAVKVPIWLWIDDPAPMTLTVAVRGLSVTVTAKLTSTTWSMGEPFDPADPASKVASFTCQGAGTPAPARPDPKAKPPCGYTYIWKSLRERTNGAGTWPVTATTNWAVTWTASDGTNGALPRPLTPATTRQIAVGEWRSSLIAGPDG